MRPHHDANFQEMHVSGGGRGGGRGCTYLLNRVVWFTKPFDWMKKSEKRCTVFNKSSGVVYPQGALPYMGYRGMCRCEGYGFHAVYSSIGYINQSVWV